MSSDNSLPNLRARYDELWAKALKHFGQTGVEVDAHLAQPARDGRRGLTLLARPSPASRAAVAGFFRQLERVLPGQYFYPEASLHLTVLSLFTATEQFEPYYRQLPAYQRVVEEAVRQVGQFAVRFRGITASPGGVMVQGFPHNETLEQLRAALRAGLGAAGLTRGLDTRYRLATAHLTVVRFQRQPDDIGAMQIALSRYREHEFGETVVEQLELVKNDWYMSPGRVSLVAAYPLMGQGAQADNLRKLGTAHGEPCRRHNRE